MFKTQFDPHGRVYCPAGSPIKETFYGEYDKAGVLQIKPKGTINLYEEIQSHAESVDIYTIIARCENGEPDLLTRRQGLFADISEMPNNFAEMLNKVQEGEELFASLSTEVKEKFNNSVTEFIATMGSPDWFGKLGINSEPSSIDSPASTPSDPAPEGGLS